jgi:hypothetical protein
MRLGSQTPSIFGWDLANRFGRIKRQSNLDLFTLLAQITDSSHADPNLISQCAHIIHRLKLKAVYMYAAGFYTYSIFALMFWETRRADFGVSMSHHVATVVLIILSYVFRYAFCKRRCFMNLKCITTIFLVFSAHSVQFLTCLSIKQVC